MATEIKAYELAKEQKEISISEFFEKNRHLLGFDNPQRALLTTVKEMVDNSLDATEEMRVLPDIFVSVKQLSEDRFCVVVEDNGPGIVKEQIPRIFGKLLYGSKFFKLSQSRGQQGLGVSASVLYSQLTTGKPTKIISKISPKKPAHYYELQIDIKSNEPEIVQQKEVEWNKEHGTKVELELEARYLKSKQSPDEYLKQTAIVNPHLNLVYINPQNETTEWKRAVNQLPVEPKRIKPHPYGIEIGILIRMLKSTSARTIGSFLASEFCRVSTNTAKEICKKAGVEQNIKPEKVAKEDIEKLIKAMVETKLMAPPTDCLSPIGAEVLEGGLKKEISAEFYCSTTRPAAVYRGMPFRIEVAVCYGGSLESEKSAKLLRFANRVPLLFQQGACAITDAVSDTNWRPYGLSQSEGSLPVGPCVIVVHMASVWVPFTSEGKEAIAHYPEIIKEMKLALQDCGRKLGGYIRRNVRAREHREKINLFEKYIPELANSLSVLTDEKSEKLALELNKILKKEIPDLLNISAGQIEEDEKPTGSESEVKTKKEEIQTKLKAEIKSVRKQKAKRKK